MENKATLNYFRLIRTALSEIIRKALLVYVSAESYSSEHNKVPCHITFLVETKHPDVSLPADLVARHSREITLVLQNEFWQMKVGKKAFSVVLRFDGKPQKITVPFNAILQWIDHKAGISFSLPPFPVAKKPTNKRLKDKNIKGKIVHLKDFQKRS